MAWVCNQGVVWNQGVRINVTEGMGGHREKKGTSERKEWKEKMKKIIMRGKREENTGYKKWRRYGRKRTMIKWAG